MPLSEKQHNLPQTMQERWDLLDRVVAMVVNDFGVKPQGVAHDPFEPGDIARHSVLEIAAAYTRFAETDIIADRILQDHDHPDTGEPPEYIS